MFCFKGKFDEVHGDIPSALVVLKNGIKPSDVIVDELKELVKGYIGCYFKVFYKIVIIFKLDYLL